jgi:hypothetical protein
METARIGTRYIGTVKLGQGIELRGEPAEMTVANYIDGDEATWSESWLTDNNCQVTLEMKPRSLHVDLAMLLEQGLDDEDWKDMRDVFRIFWPNIDVVVEWDDKGKEAEQRANELALTNLARQRGLSNLEAAKAIERYAAHKEDYRNREIINNAGIQRRLVTHRGQG